MTKEELEKCKVLAAKIRLGGQIQVKTLSDLKDIPYYNVKRIHSHIFVDGEICAKEHRGADQGRYGFSPLLSSGVDTLTEYASVRDASCVDDGYWIEMLIKCLETGEFCNDRQRA